MNLDELLEGFRVGKNTSVASIRRRFKDSSNANKKKRSGKAKHLSKGKSGFGRPPRQREIRGNR
jgi:hypothetical protein